jgi:hypothetical protein
MVDFRVDFVQDKDNVPVFQRFENGSADKLSHIETQHPDDPPVVSVCDPVNCKTELA